MDIIGGIFMRKIKRVIAFVMALMILLTVITATNVGSIESEAASGNNDKKACWISYIDIGSYLKNKSEKDFRNKISGMYDKVLENNMDTVIVHVRAMGDAIYPSSYFPWATYISDNRKSPGYDPLKIMIEIAHSKGIKFEAWVNPYRISLGNTITNSYMSTSYYQKYKSYMIQYKNSAGETCLVFDPSKKEARDIIVKGIKEIVSNYDVDGIHFDDYFYVDGMAPGLDLGTKKKNVNALITEVYSTIKSIDSNCVFGVSPEGNLDNARAQGADIDTWLANKGYVDYIMPQIYWTDKYMTSSGMTTMFTNRCNNWMAINKAGIPIYVGLALYRVGEKSSSDLGWTSSNTNLADQYKIARDLGFDGYALFRYAWLENSSAATELTNLKTYVDSIEGKYSYVADSYISYTTHVQSYGWQTAKADGVLSGTTGLGKRLEAISISLGEKTGDGGVTYRTHVQSHGWMPWVSDGVMSGTSGQSKRMEAIQIKLTGEADKKYDIYYRVHCQSYGWLDWAKNGEPAGTATYGKRLEAVQIVLVKKGDKAPGPTASAYKTRLLEYNSHVQTYGWLSNSYDGEPSGTTGQAKRLESIQISLTDKLVEGSIIYRTHVQTHGWLTWVSDGAKSGTEGQGKRLEAIEIKLDGPIKDKYDIYYRVHCQTHGWMSWVKNGETAGTYGESKRLEAIEIKLLPKGQTP